MPSKSKAQHRLMEAVKHNPKFAKKVGIKQSVGEDFVAADKRGGRYATGGGVLGALGSAAGRLMPRRIPPAGSIPMLQGVDQSINNARGQLGVLRKRGGKT